APGQVPIGVLVTDPAHGVGIFAGERAVEHGLGHRDLAPHWPPARLEIDRIGETLLRLGAAGNAELETLSRCHRAPVGAGDLALGGDRLATPRRSLLDRKSTRLNSSH